MIYRSVTLLLFVAFLAGGCTGPGRPGLLPTAPGLEVHPVSEHEVRLEWKSYQGVLLLERRRAGQTHFQVLETFQPGERRYVDSRLAVNVRYQYRLRPQDARYLQEFGEIANVRLELPPPPAPTLVRIGVDDVEVRFTGRDHWSGGVAVERRVRGAYREVGRIVAGDSVFREQDLPVHQRYLYRFRYLTDASQSAPSPPDTIHLPFPAPPAPEVIVESDRAVLVDWTAPTRFPCRYEVEKSVGDSLRWLEMTDSTTQWRDEAARLDQRAYYRVRGVSGENRSDFSDPATVRIQLKPVKNISLDSVLDRRVRITWEDPERVARWYRIHRSVEGRTLAEVSMLPASERSFVDELDYRGVLVTYRIVSVAGDSSRVSSEPVSQYIPRLEEDMVRVPSDGRHFSFYIDFAEVSVEEYREFCLETGREMPPDPGFDPYPGYWRQASSLPAVHVSWLDAADYCNWRSERVGLAKAYDDEGNLIAGAPGYRLPNRQEYDRALSLVPGGWQAALDGSNLMGEEDGSLWPAVADTVYGVGNYPANLIGNVWEWLDEERGEGKVFCIGGGFSTPQELVDRVPETVYPRYWHAASIGFRCLLPSRALSDESQ